MSHASCPADSIPRLLVSQAESLGDKPLFALSGQPQAITYASLVCDAETGSTRLREEYGVQPGQVAAIFLPNGTAFVRAWFACLFAGIADIPVNYEFRKTALLFMLANTDVSVVFTDAAGLAALQDEEVRGYLPRLRLIVAVGSLPAVPLAQPGGAAPPVVTLDDLLGNGPRRRVWEGVAGTSLASIRYTSGTTGPAKGVMQSHLHILNKGVVHRRIMEMGRSDILYSPFPLHHSLASLNGLIGTITAGATMVSAMRFSASDYWPAIRRSSATRGHVLFPLVPLLLKQQPTAADRDHACRYLWTAWPHPEFEQRFNVTLIQIYGMGELGIAAYRRGGGGSHERAAGKPLPDMTVRIVDELDQPLPQGRQGEIVVRPKQPHHVMLGYYGNLDATIRAFRNLWLHTGDQGYLDLNGELVFLGRLGDTIRRRGVNISSEQIEEEILRHPRVAECAVIGVPAEFGEEEIMACLTWRDAQADVDAELADLLGFLRARLPGQYVPRYFQPTPGMPRTPTGKIRKVDLRTMQPPRPRWDRDTGTWV